MGTIFDGEPLVLNAAGYEFPAVYTRAKTEAARGTAIILHGRGTHPDREQVAGPLHKPLPGHDRNILPLQLPVQDKRASDKDYQEIMAEAPAPIAAVLSAETSDWQDALVPVENQPGSCLPATAAAGSATPG